MFEGFQIALEFHFALHRPISERGYAQLSSGPFRVLRPAQGRLWCAAFHHVRVPGFSVRQLRPRRAASRLAPVFVAHVSVQALVGGHHLVRDEAAFARRSARDPPGTLSGKFLIGPQKMRRVSNDERGRLRSTLSTMSAGESRLWTHPLRRLAIIPSNKGTASVGRAINRHSPWWCETAGWIFPIPSAATKLGRPPR